MRRRSLAGLTGLAVVIALAACGGDDTGSGATSGTVPSVSDTTPGSSVPPSSAPSSTPPLSVKPLPPASSQVPGTALDPLVADAVADLARQLDVSPDDVTVVAAREVTWPDGSLGCPEPGMMYTQALVDGTLVVLEANGQRYEYHGGTPLVLCENPKPPYEG